MGTRPDLSHRGRGRGGSQGRLGVFRLPGGKASDGQGRWRCRRRTGSAARSPRSRSTRSAQTIAGKYPGPSSVGFALSRPQTNLVDVSGHPRPRRSAATPLPHEPTHAYFCRAPASFVTELIQIDINSVTHETAHESGIAGAIRVPGRTPDRFPDGQVRWPGQILLCLVVGAC